MRHALASLLLLIFVVALSPVASQTMLRDAPGTWKPWKALSAVASVRTERGATAAEVKAFEATLLELNAILRRAPGVATPRGFSVETWGAMSGLGPAAPGRPAGRALPLGGSLDFGAFPIFEYQRGGKTIREDSGETALLLFNVNDPWAGGRRAPAEWSGIDTDAFLQPAAAGEIAGIPRFGDTLVIARSGQSLWTPLSIVDALGLAAAARQAEATSFEEAAARFTARLATLRDPVRQAQRRKDGLPDAVARIEEDTVVKELSPSSSTSKGLAEAKRALSEIAAYIAALAPAERTAPSCYAADGRDVRGTFKVAPATRCVPLVTPNYRYFNPALPRSTAQVLTIGPVDRCFDTANAANREANDASPAGCTANRKLVETMDLAAIRAWLK